MKARPLFIAGSVVCVMMLGCRPGEPRPGPQPSPVPGAGQTSSRATPASSNRATGAQRGPVITDATDTTDIAPGNADTLASKAQAYSKSMEAAVEKRAARKTKTDAADSAEASRASAHATGSRSAEQSGVVFVDPKEEVQTPAPPATQQAPTSNAAAANTGLSATADPQPTTAPAQPSTARGGIHTDVPVPAEFNKDTPSANAPLSISRAGAPTVDEITRRTAQMIKDDPQDISAHFEWQLLQFLKGESVPQLQTLTPLASEDREMLAAIFDGLTNFRNGVRADSTMLLSRKVRPILEAADRLRQQAELSIPNFCLCSNVDRFGAYDPIDPPRFAAGEVHKVVIYCEVENFSSQLDAMKRWQTKLTQEMVLYADQTGQEIWHDKADKNVIDLSRTRRHDFFFVKMIKLPANLTIGRYVLKMTVTDQQANRVAESTTPIEIVLQ